MLTSKKIISKFELDDALAYVSAQLYLIEIFDYINVSIESLKSNLKTKYPDYYEYLYRFNNKQELFIGVLEKKEKPIIQNYLNELDNLYPTNVIFPNKLSMTNSQKTLEYDIEKEYGFACFLFLKDNYKNPNKNSQVELLNSFAFYNFKKFQNVIWV